MQSHVPDELDWLHVGLLVAVCVLILVVPFVTLWNAGDDGAAAAPPAPPESDNPDPIGERANTYLPTVNASATVRDADAVLWVAADSQPEWQGGDNPYRGWARLNASADDIAALPVTPDLTVLPGDIPDPYSESQRNESPLSPQQNIAMTRASYDRIPWFDTGEDTVYATGNHERGYFNESAQAFGESCGARDLPSAEHGNIKVLALCMAPGEPIPNASLTALNDRLDALENEATDWNVFVTMHYPIKGTVSNCHSLYNPDINRLDNRSHADRYLDITRRHADSVAATITGHIHGRWRDAGRPVVETANQTFIDAPVFGGHIRSSRGASPAACDTWAHGVGDSLFLAVENGATEATGLIRHSCDDPDADGECERDGYWSDAGTTISLPNPATVGTADS